MAKKVIKNKVPFCSTVELDTFLSLQGKLKKTKAEDMLKLRSSLKRRGIIFPLFVWPDNRRKINWLLDGVHRVICLKELRDMGFKIEPIPVVVVKARNKNEAKKIVLLADSHHSIITKKGFNAFVESMNMEKIVGDLNFKDIKLEFHIPEEDVKDIDTNAQFLYSRNELKELQDCLQVLRNNYRISADTGIIFRALENHMGAK